MNKYFFIIIFSLILVYYFYSNSKKKNKESFTNTPNYKISVVLLVKNNGNYINYMSQVFKEIEDSTNFEFKYYIYENNSTDDSKIKLTNFMKNRKGKLILENIDKEVKYTQISNVRGNLMANLRNKLKDAHGKLNSDFTILMDSDIIFNKNTLVRMLQVINNDNIVMVTPYSICGNIYKKYNSFHYYDSFALISNDNISYKESLNTCLDPKCQKCLNFRRVKGLVFDKKYLLSNDINKVKSAFGGFCLINTNIYNNVNWDSTICEHHSFCEKVRKYGDIVVANNIKTFMAPEKYTENEFYLISMKLDSFNN